MRILSIVLSLALFSCSSNNSSVELIASEVGRTGMILSVDEKTNVDDDNALSLLESIDSLTRLRISLGSEIYIDSTGIVSEKRQLKNYKSQTSHYTNPKIKKEIDSTIDDFNQRILYVSISLDSLRLIRSTIESSISSKKQSFNSLEYNYKFQ